ncbi:MAG: hypothetical protein RIQ60_2292 [Pseudomonadota bacterium]|jgi:O-antigen ligase
MLSAVSIFVLFVAVFLGLSVTIFPWWINISFVILIAGLLFTATYPEIGLIIYLVFVAGIIPESIGLSLGIGSGKIQSHELLIFLTLIISAFKRDSQRVLTNRWHIPIYALLFTGFLGVIVGIFFANSSAKDVVQEARVQLNWLIAPVAFLLINDKKALDRVINGILLLAFIISLAVLAQFFGGIKILGNARVEDLNTLNESFSDITRSTAGGSIYLVIFSLFFVCSTFTISRARIIYLFPLIGIFSAAIIVSFGRGIWISTFLCALLLGGMLGRAKGLLVVLISSCAIAVFSVGGLSLVKPRMAEVAFERLLSTAKEGQYNSSLDWRVVEAEYAIPRIQSSPIFGIGFGTPYKPFQRLSGTESDVALMRYIHNSALGLWLKMGFGGLVIAVWLSIRVVRGGWRLSRQEQGRDLFHIAAALTASFGVPLITSVTQPEWFTSTGVAFFALIIGLLSTVDKLITAKSSQLVIR